VVVSFFFFFWFVCLFVFFFFFSEKITFEIQDTLSIRPLSLSLSPPPAVLLHNPRFGSSPVTPLCSSIGNASSLSYLNWRCSSTTHGLGLHHASLSYLHRRCSSTTYGLDPLRETPLSSTGNVSLSLCLYLFRI
jgi:hypothetical protein